MTQAKNSGQPEVHALVLSGFGINCDLETTYALTRAGAAASRVHINDRGG